jgi:Family of unknown function (DUF5946)
MAAYTLTHGDAAFVHQYLVDARYAQHAEPTKSNIGLAFSLIGLYLAVEKGFTGRQVQLAHMQLGKTKRVWPWFDPPKQIARVSILDVSRAEPGADRDQVLLDWCGAVWETWSSQAQHWTRQTCAELLDVNP